MTVFLYYFLVERSKEIMLRDFGIFISLVCLLVSVIIVLNARWVIHCIDNSKDLENKMVNKIKVLAALVSIVSLYIVTILIKKKSTIRWLKR